MPDLIGDVPDVDGSPLRVCTDGGVVTLGRPGQPLWRLGTAERDLFMRLVMRAEFAAMEVPSGG